MKTKIVMLLLFAALEAFCQAPSKSVNFFVYQINFQGVEDVQLRERIERSFKGIIYRKIKECPKYLSSKDESNVEALIFFSDTSEIKNELSKHYQLNNNISVPKGTNVVIFSKFRIDGAGMAYMEMGIYTKQEKIDSDYFQSREYLLDDMNVYESREQFISKLVDLVLDGETIEKLVETILGPEEVPIDCNSKVSKGIIEVEVDLPKNTQVPPQLGFRVLTTSKSDNGMVKLILNKRKGILGKRFKSILTKEIDINSLSNQVQFYKSGNYQLLFIAHGSILSDTIALNNIKISPKKFETYQSIAIGAGISTLGVSLISHLQAKRFYNQYKYNSLPSRELEFQKASSLNKIAVYTFYSGVALIAGTLFDYHLNISRDKKTSFTIFDSGVGIRLNLD